MKMTKVKSSNIDKIGFQENKKLSFNSAPINILRIEFKNERVYDYYHVRLEVYEAFLKSESKGRFFHRYIDKEYDCERIQ